MEFMNRYQKLEGINQTISVYNTTYQKTRQELIEKLCRVPTQQMIFNAMPDIENIYLDLDGNITEHRSEQKSNAKNNRPNNDNKQNTTFGKTKSK